jgi:hypothetical protein
MRFAPRRRVNWIVAGRDHDQLIRQRDADPIRQAVEDERSGSIP